MSLNRILQNPSESIELPVSAYEHEGIEMIDLTNLPMGTRELEMSNKNLRGRSNVPEEDDEFPSIKELLAVTDKTGPAEGVDHYNDEGTNRGQPSPPPSEEAFRLGNTILFPSHNYSINHVPLLSGRAITRIVL